MFPRVSSSIEVSDKRGSEKIFYNFLLLLVNAVAGTFQIVLFAIFIWAEEGSLAALRQNVVKHIVMDVKTTFKMSLPPILLILSSELLRISSDPLPVQSQSANNYLIIGVLIFAVLVLKKKFYLSQALAIYLVAKGLDQFPAENNLWIDEQTATTPINTFFGHFTIMWAILCYGLSYVVLELILKSSEVSLWIRGIQMNLFTVPLYLIMSFTEDRSSEIGFFENFNLIACFFIVFTIAQRMMELFVIKVVDSVYRCLALATALVIIGIIRNPFTDALKLGSGLVLAGACLYAVMDHFPKWGEIHEAESEDEYRESPVDSAETIAKGYQNVQTVSSAVERGVPNAEVYLKLID